MVIVLVPEDDTDVLLADRYNEYYNENQLTCQANCEYSDYSPDSQYLKCECDVVNEEKIEIKEPEKITAKSVIKSFYNVLKYSNYKVLKCSNLVFRGVTFYQNGGSILTIIYFFGYLGGFILFLFKRINELKNEIGKLFVVDKKKKRDLKNERKNETHLKSDLLAFNKKEVHNTEMEFKKWMLYNLPLYDVITRFVFFQYFLYIICTT